MSSQVYAGFQANLIKIFQTDDLYKIFEVGSKANNDMIKKSWRRLALRHHPDKGGDVEAFKALCTINDILIDDSKRQVYDEHGFESNFDHDDTYWSTSDEKYSYWYKFYRELFPKLKENDIDEFKLNYINSNEQKKDILEAYTKYKGNINKMISHLFFIEKGEEYKLFDVIDEALKQNEVPLHDIYRKQRSKYTYPQHLVVERLNSESTDKSASTSVENIQSSSSDVQVMRSLIKKNGKADYSAIIKKYGIPDDVDDDIPDDEFYRIQENLKKRKKLPSEDLETTKTKTKTKKQPNSLVKIKKSQSQDETQSMSLDDAESLNETRNTKQSGNKGHCTSKSHSKSRNNQSTV